jgi:hypothetical protein
VNRCRAGEDAGPQVHGDGNGSRLRRELSKVTTERPNGTANAEPRVRAPYGHGEAPAALVEGCTWGRRWR